MTGRSAPVITTMKQTEQGRLKIFLHKAFNAVGFDIIKHRERTPLDNLPPDLSAEDVGIIAFARPYTMTTNERIIALIEAVRHLTRNGISGAIAECGVWKGGSMMAAARTLLAAGDASRELYLYDTFEGMSEPTEADKSFDERPARDQLAETPPNEGIWCYSSFDEVRANLASTGYPMDKIRFVKGRIEETVPANNPPELALLRLDTDWYESTRHELEHLFPLLKPGGILIIDDYGHWQGARRAVDEFLAAAPEKYFLHRIDYSGRLLVKH